MLDLRQLSLEAKAAVAAGVVFFSMMLSRTYLGGSVGPGVQRWLFRLQLALFANALMLIGSLYIWRCTVTSLCRPLRSGSACPGPWKAAVGTFLALAHSSFFTTLFLVAEEPYLFSLAAYSCLGAYVIMIFFLFTLGCMEQGYRLLAWRGGVPGAGADKTRRAVAKPLLAVAVTALLSVVGLLNAARPPAVKTVEVPLRQLPPSMDGLKVVLLSDIHLGPTVGRTKMEQIVRTVEDLEPDVTVIVGDLTDSEASVLRRAVEPLGRLRCPLGTYFVTGNHEYYTSDVNNWFELLESLGVRPLHNENVKVTVAGASAGDTAGRDWICLAGVDDIEADVLRYSGHGMDLSKALGDCGPDHATVLLAHQPLAAKWALQARPDIDLILSGHTHGGQIFPLNVGAYLLNPFFAGLYRVGESTFVYVSPGTVYYGIPMRLGSRAEITEIILRAL
ncbi:transmembrane protein with metallophosphoesterase domain [Tachyglossus aculeatus]|uniref:transmembrane protein with metallophosphoesterase domain n=1 Tax=Tachyglossus aculeatus TaxID=9261 RepID=UPI0018F6429C|nr:transmembrane protein with metallophosphoesterase domain [Tachyglossus aculeatus]XP_038615772.1 transmembrane protein with metallophosphoesterase domain [Tachyglossus aculeatus]